MKIIVFIMAVMVLVCSFIPCRDSAFAISIAKVENKASKSSTNEKGHKEKEDCSPFCSCSCCCTITVHFTAYRVEHLILVPRKQSIFHLPSKISDTSLPVWQPPQLV